MTNPSAWFHRRLVALLALIGCGLATYLTLYQWHLTASVWDPVFGASSSEAVLTSATSRMLPLPDATLGALAYLVEAIVTLLGGTDRWHSAPYLVVLYGIVLAGLVLTSIALVLIQILLVRQFCTLCLVSATISLANAWIGHNEVFAALRQLERPTSVYTHSQLP